MSPDAGRLTSEKPLNFLSVRADDICVSPLSLHDREVRRNRASAAGASDSAQTRRSQTRQAGFDRTVREVLEHLRRTSPIAQWVVVRFDGSAMHVVQSIGESFAIAPDLALHRADIAGKPSVRTVGLRENSRLVSQFGVRSCVAALIPSPTTGTSAAYGAIVGIDACVDVEVSEVLVDQLRLHALHLASALAQHHFSFAREHARLCRVDSVNGFDTPEAWVERVHVLERHCAAVGESAVVAVVALEDRASLNRRLGHLGADEFLREISFVLRAVSLPNAFFGFLDDSHLVLVRLATLGFDDRYWERDLRSSLAAAMENDVLKVACRLGVSPRLRGERRSIEQAQTRARDLAECS